MHECYCVACSFYFIFFLIQCITVKRFALPMFYFTSTFLPLSLGSKVDRIVTGTAHAEKEMKDIL